MTRSGGAWSGSSGKDRPRAQRDPRAGVPCRVVCLVFSIYTILCLLMPWAVLIPRELRSQGIHAADPQALFLYPNGILGLPDILSYFARGSLAGTVAYVAASLACAVALVLIVAGTVQVARFRGGVGQLRLGLGIVAFAVVLGGTLVMVLQPGTNGSMLSPTPWGEYAVICAAVASIAATRYDRLAGPDVDAEDALLRGEGCELDERHIYGRDGRGNDPETAWYERSELAVRQANPGRAAGVMRTIACVCGVLWVLATLPVLVSLCVKTHTDAGMPDGALGIAATLVTLAPTIALWLTAVGFVIQGIASFVRSRCGTGCLRTGALLGLLCGATVGGTFTIASLLTTIAPDLSEGAIANVTTGWLLFVLFAALLTAFFSGLADGVVFTRTTSGTKE